MDVQESLDFIIEKMATKSDLERMATKTDIAEIQKTLDDHTSQLNNIHTDVKTMRDKRLQLEVRVGHIEEHLHLKPPAGTVQ